MAETNWCALLVEAAQRDLDLRAQLAASGELFHGYHPMMEETHLANAALLERAFDAIGWPGHHAVGDEGAAAAMLILQHAIGRPDLQRRGLALMLAAVSHGEASALDAAYLADRVAVFEGRSQLFGTQFDWDDEGLLSPAPIAEPDGVDERRASVGLPPLAEAIAEMRARSAAEGETAPGDLATRRAQFAAWAARVGWRA